MSGLFGGGQSNSQVQDRVSEMRLQTSSYGQPIPVVLGTTRVPANVVYHEDFQAIPHTTTQRVGKGGGSTTSNTSYTYTAAVILALCEGPVEISGKVFRDKETFASPDALGLTVLEGNVTQSPWTYLTSLHPDQAVGYGSTAYVCHPAMDLGDSGTLKNHSFVVRGFFATATPGGDANVADVLFDILTHPIHGAGWPSESIGSLSDLRGYTAAAGIFVSVCYNEQRQMVEHLSQLLQIANAAPVWSGGKLQIVPYGDQPIGSWTPNTTPLYDLGPDDFLVSGPGDDPIKITRKSPADAYNSLQLEYQNRKNDYADEVAEASDLGAQELFRIRAASPVKAPEIVDPAVARVVAQILLQKHLYLRNSYEFRLGWRYILLEPMNLVTLTDSTLGLNKTPVRIEEVEEDETGDILVKAVEWLFGVASATAYTNPGGSPTGEDWNLDPGPTHWWAIQANAEFTGGWEGIMIAAQGEGGSSNWGGAEIWASRDGASYEPIGTIRMPARMGTIRTPLPALPDGQYTGAIDLELGSEAHSLHSVSPTAAAAFANLVILRYGYQVEFASFQDAQLVGARTYRCTTWQRALYGRLAGAFSAGQSDFAMVGPELFRVNLDDWEWAYGDTIWIKLASFNKYGMALQSLADVTPQQILIRSPDPRAAASDGQNRHQPIIQSVSFT